MSSRNLVLSAAATERLKRILRQVREDANGLAAFLVDRSGRFLAGSGEEERLDTASLASLVAGSVAATGSLAQLLGERGLGSLFHEGERVHLYLVAGEGGAILVVLFDRRSSLGLVRFQARSAHRELGRLLADIAGGQQEGPGVAQARMDLAEITDEDIENLLST
jgi:predicted regulator of Ras-like GTPase activity (Roadblock/LC7/MglB family)